MPGDLRGHEGGHDVVGVRVLVPGAGVELQVFVGDEPEQLPGLDRIVEVG
jgi:hypothetical protein